MAMNAVIEVRRFPLGDRRNSRGNRVLEVFGFGPAKNLNSSGDGNGSRGAVGHLLLVRANRFLVVHAAVIAPRGSEEEKEEKDP
jgi:hypothetical protein